MTISLPARRSGRRTALAATLALAASSFAFAAVTDAAEAKRCPTVICDPVDPTPKFPWPPEPQCLSCPPDKTKLFERYQEIVLPEVAVELLPEILNPRGPGGGFEGELGRGGGFGGPGR